jgi:hypothetical protein
MLQLARCFSQIAMDAEDGEVENVVESTVAPSALCLSANSINRESVTRARKFEIHHQ